MNPSNLSLQSQLDARKADFEAKASVELKTIYAEGLQAVEKSGLLKTAKSSGLAPDFTLTNAVGRSVTLSHEWKKGPVILTWYRGGWCPYCNLTLAYLQESLPLFQSFKAQLLALTPELPDKSLSTKEKHNLQFEVLSDVGNKVAREYGIVFKLTEAVAQSYQKSFDLHSYNGDTSDELPLAATYIIDTQGMIRYAFLDVEYRRRAEPEELLKVLRSL